jgi:UDP-glucose 4-epimerase
MARILVTGGAGFIGSHVVDAYLAAGHEVSVVDNLLSGKRENLNPQARFYEIDVRSDELAGVFEAEKPAYVTHLAAQIDVRRSVADPRFDADINILGGINLLENCVKHQVKKFLFSSTGGAIYGEPETLPASEECPPNPQCHYAASKLSFEHYIRLYHSLYQLRYTILRFPNIYGPRQSPEGEAGVCSILTGLMLEGKQPTLFGHGTPERDYVFVGDIARGALLALDKGDNMIINLGSGKSATVQNLFDILKDLTGYVGEPMLKPLRMGEVQRVFITGDRAAEVLGWRAETTLREGLRQTVEHIRGQVGG